MRRIKYKKPHIDVPSRQTKLDLCSWINLTLSVLYIDTWKKSFVKEISTPKCPVNPLKTGWYWKKLICWH